MQVHLKRFTLITSFFVRMGNFAIDLTDLTDFSTIVNHQPTTSNPNNQINK